MKRLEAFEMWCFRRMLRIPWTDHILNESVLDFLDRDRELLKMVKRRKVSYFGHMVRGPKYTLLRTIMEGKIEGKRGIGRKSMSWLRNIRKWTGLSVEELFRLAPDRERFRDLIQMIA